MLLRWNKALAKGWKEELRLGSLAGLAAVFFLTGCDSTESAIREQEAEMQRQHRLTAKQRELNRLLAAEERAWQTLEPLMREAANYQESETFGYLGASFVTERFYPSRLTRLSHDNGFGPYISVAHVFPDTPADRAGLMRGDRIVAINGTKMPRWDRAARFASSKVKRLLKPGEVNEIEVSRAGKTYKVAMDALPAAYYAIVVSPDALADLRADGEIIWLDVDFIEQHQDPDRFAYACAFTLAQNIMRHPEKRRKNKWMGQVFDIAAQASGITTTGVLGNLSGRRYHWAFTVEADLIALYLLAAAGHDVTGYPDFWTKQMALASKDGMLDSRDRDRVEIMRQVIGSIMSKQDSGRFIFPEEYLAGDTSETRVPSYAGNFSPIPQK